MKETRETVLTATQDLTTALPRGQYNLLIRDLNGPDKEKKAQAQAFLRSLGHLEDPDAPIEASVWFGFEPSPSAPVKADAFRAQTLSRSEVEQRDVFKAGNLRPVGSSLSLSLSTDALRFAISNINDIDKLFKSTPTMNGWYGSLFVPIIINCPDGSGCSMADAIGVQQLHDARRAEFINHLRTAIMAQYEQNFAPLTESDLPAIPWSTLDGKQFLFVCIRQSDWNKHKKDPKLRVRALIHYRGNLDKRVRIQIM
jgi:hypothetical protein